MLAIHIESSHILYTFKVSLFHKTMLEARNYQRKRIFTFTSVLWRFFPPTMIGSQRVMTLTGFASFSIMSPYI